MRRVSLVALAACVALAGAAAVPAASIGAVVFYEDGVGLTYRAAPGEVNHLTMNPFAGPIEGVSISSMTIQDDTAPLEQLGEFCLPETPLRCPSVATYAYMGGGNDYGVAGPYVRDAYIWGQGGNDDVSATGRDHAVAFGGPGNDRVTAGADVDAEAWGQAGDDDITAHGNVRGDRGNDRVDVSGNPDESDVVACGPGRDAVTADRATASPPTAKPSPSSSHGTVRFNPLESRSVRLPT